MDTFDLSTECFRKALLEVTGKEYTVEELMPYFGMVRRISFDILGIDEKIAI